MEVDNFFIVCGWNIAKRKKDEEGKDGGREICLHCTRRAANRPRGLCSICYYSPGIREMYQPRTPWSRHGANREADFYGSAPLPDTSTDAEPGSEAKIRILQERAARRQMLHHPQDRQMDPPPSPLMDWLSRDEEEIGTG